MNFKKFISSVSALAVAAGAFAGLAVTASAVDYKIDEVLYGTLSGNTVTAQTDFTGDNAASNVDKTYAGTAFMAGTALQANAGITTNFTNPVTSGKVHFSTSYTVLGGNANLIKLVDSEGRTVVGLYPKDSSSSATIDAITIDTAAVGSIYVYTPRNVAYSVDVTIDLDAKTYAYSITYCTGGSSGTVNKVATSTGDGNITNISDVAGLSATKSSYDYYMDNISLYSEKSSETLYDYTVNYTLGEATVKTSEGSVPVDTVITAEGSFTENGTKYYIIADEVPTVTVSADGENVLDVPVRVANNYTLSVVAAGDISKTMNSATIVEGETFAYTYPQYIVENGIAYEAEKQNSGFYGSVDNVKADQNVAITYTKAYENVVFLEDLDGTAAENANIRASNGLANDNTEYTSSTEIQPGTYTFVIRYQDKGRGSSIKVGDVNLLTYPNTSRGTWNDVTVEDVEITTAAPIMHVAGANGTWDDLDTILVYGTVAGSDPVTPAEAGAVTLVGDYDENDGVFAKAFTFTVTPNDETVTKVTLDVAGQTASKTCSISDGPAIFGILVSADDAAKLPNADAFTVTLN